MRVAILGKSGQLARCLADSVPPGFTPFFLGREELDLGGLPIDLAPLEEVRPDLVINSSAYTAVDRAEAETEAAEALNARAPARLAEFCHAHAIPLVHVSTDYVFDGRKESPYSETDTASPLNTYGRSKLAGETAIAATCLHHVIIRTSWLYSAYGHNFVKTMLRLAAEREQLTIVADQIGRPTSAHSLARALWQVAARIAGARESVSWGLYHYADAGIMSWAEFAEMIFSEAGNTVGKVPEVRHIPTADYPTPAQRPLRTILDCSKFEANFGVKSPAPEASLRDVIKLLHSESVQ